MSRRFAKLLVALCASLLLAQVPEAQAWEALEYCNGSPTQWPAGNPNSIWQLSTSFPSTDLGVDEVGQAVEAAFAQWAEPSCSEFNAQRGEDIAADPTTGDDGIFTVGFYEEQWPAALGVNVLAVAPVTTPLDRHHL